MVWITRYVNADQIGACINHQVFFGAVRPMPARPQSWNCRGPVNLCARWGASVVRFLLGANFIIRTGELRSRCFPACNFRYVLVGLRKYPPSTK